MKTKKVFLMLLFIFSITMFTTYSFKAWAFKISPMVATLSPEGGKNSSTTFQINNDKDEVISIEVEVTSRSIDISGKEERKSTNDLKAYPLQFQLKAKEIKNIRVVWTGKKDIKTEMPFRLIVRQLPIKTSKDENNAQGGQIKFLFEYVASIYVRPSNVKPKLVVESVIQDKEKEDSVLLTIKNEGTEHIVLKNIEIMLSKMDDSNQIKIDEKQIEQYLNENILAGSSRAFSIKTPPELKDQQSKINAKIKIKEE